MHIHAHGSTCLYMHSEQVYGVITGLINCMVLAIRSVFPDWLVTSRLWLLICAHSLGFYGIVSTS